MDIKPFTITLSGASRITAEIRPCCREDNVVDYAVWIDNKLAFTITRDVEANGKWNIALKNADDDIADELVQEIGAAIDHVEG